MIIENDEQLVNNHSFEQKKKNFLLRSKELEDFFKDENSDLLVEKDVQIKFLYLLEMFIEKKAILVVEKENIDGLEQKITDLLNNQIYTSLQDNNFIFSVLEDFQNRLSFLSKEISDVLKVNSCFKTAVDKLLNEEIIYENKVFLGMLEIYSGNKDMRGNSFSSEGHMQVYDLISDKMRELVLESKMKNQNTKEKKKIERKKV